MVVENLQALTVDIPGDMQLGEVSGGVGDRGGLEALVVIGEMSVSLAGSMAVLSCLPPGFSLWPGQVAASVFGN